MKLRTGRHNPRNLYLQIGDNPSDKDPCIGFMIDGDIAELIADCMNDGDRSDLIAIGDVARTIEQATVWARSDRAGIQ